jgi:hypothetical protein
MRLVLGPNVAPSQAMNTESGAKGTRTPDLLVANETRYRLRHSPADRWADQHRDFTTVRQRQTSAIPRLPLPYQCPKPTLERLP